MYSTYRPSGVKTLLLSPEICKNQRYKFLTPNGQYILFACLTVLQPYEHCSGKVGQGK